MFFHNVMVRPDNFAHVCFSLSLKMNVGGDSVQYQLVHNRSLC